MNIYETGSHSQIESMGINLAYYSIVHPQLVLKGVNTRVRVSWFGFNKGIACNFLGAPFIPDI